MIKELAKLRQFKKGDDLESFMTGEFRQNMIAIERAFRDIQNGQTSQVGLVPSGVVLEFAGTTIPSGYLVCDGSAISRTTYASLFSAIGTAWGSGDGSSTFNLPDLRGKFLRGVDGSAGNDPDSASRTANATGGNTGDNVGSIQSDQLGSHSHSITFQLAAGGSATTPQVLTANTLTTTTYSSSSSGGNETRPKNAYVYFIIKT